MRQSTWCAATLCAGWGTTALHPCPVTRQGLHDSLWHSLATEYDARHLSAFLRQGGLPLSPAFWALERAWAHDEQNHCQALTWLYSRLYGVAESAILERLSQRQPDFSLLAPLLGEEFRLCVVLAFDELASARAYARDVAVYARLGTPAATLLRYAARDEMLHCRNAIDLILCQHRDRLGETAALLDTVIAHDTSAQFSYRATFLLDQIAEQPLLQTLCPAHPDIRGLHAEFLRDCGRRLIQLLHRTQSRINSCS